MASYIDSECDLLNIPEDEKYRLYYYALVADGKAMLKPGKTHQVLKKRIRQYLFKEHKNMEKDMETFKLIAVYEFKTKNLLTKAELLMKEGFKEYPLKEEQFHATEQYQLEPCWNLLKSFLRNMPFCKKSWIGPDVENAVQRILNKAKKLTLNVPTNTKEIEYEEENEESDEESDDEEEYESNEIKKKFKEILDTNAQDVYGVGLKTCDVFRKLLSTQSLDMSTIESLCHDIEIEGKCNGVKSNIISHFVRHIKSNF